MDVTPLPMVTDTSEAREMSALFPMEVTLSGMVIDVRESQ
jgi:hypothetical protein